MEDLPRVLVFQLVQATTPAPVALVSTGTGTSRIVTDPEDKQRLADSADRDLSRATELNPHLGRLYGFRSSP